MFAFIRGKLISFTDQYCIVEAGNIGYKMILPPSSYDNLPQLGQELLLYCSFVVRELSHTLYGFLSPQERDFFEILLTLNGIGPKLALNIIGHLPYADLQLALASNDSGVLCKIPGVGKKSAARLLIDLRDKLPFEKLSTTAARGPSKAFITLHGDAHSVLVNLGYAPTAVQKALQQVGEMAVAPGELPEVITAALSFL